MIDLHCHLLPGVDDGPQTLEESIAMAEVAVAKGIRYILVTPHHRNEQYVNKKEDVFQATEAFQTVLDMKGIPLTLFPGQEVRISEDLIEKIEQNEIQFIDEGCRYLLIEFPTMSIPTFSKDVFFQLYKMGVTPVIVHPERNHVFMNHLNKLYSFIEQGALAQLTAGSYLGKFGKKIQRVSQQMLEANLVHVIASDAHNTTTRNFCIKEAMEKLEKEFGEKKKLAFSQDVKNLINGDLMVPLSPQKVIRKNKWFL